MDGAGPSCYDQRPGCVLLQQPGSERGRAVPHRIGEKPWGRRQFFAQREHLPQQRVVRVARPHAGDESARRKQGKISAARRACGFEFGQVQQPAKLERIAHGLFQRLLPGNAAQNARQSCCGQALSRKIK